MIISKKIGSTSDWWVQHISIHDGDHALKLNSDAAKTDISGDGSLSTPTNQVWYGNWNSGLMASTSTTLAYVFTAIPGYAAFGSWVGNQSTDGPFIYTNFQPRWIMFKNSSTAARDWYLIDTTRDPYNEDSSPSLQAIWANRTTAETNDEHIDILSNGFKIRTAGLNVNESGDRIIYAAFAENPFKTARAR